MAPVQITLNKAEVCSGSKADMIHYIPIKDSFTALVEDKSFNDVIRMQREADTVRHDVIKDLREGGAFKTNSYFNSNPGAYAALFYSETVEV